MAVKCIMNVVNVGYAKNEFWKRREKYSARYILRGTVKGEMSLRIR